MRASFAPSIGVHRTHGRLLAGACFDRLTAFQQWAEQVGFPPNKRRGGVRNGPKRRTQREERSWLEKRIGVSSSKSPGSPHRDWWRPAARWPQPNRDRQREQWVLAFAN